MEKHFCLDDSPMFLDAVAPRRTDNVRYRMVELDEVDSTNNVLRHLNTPNDCRMTLVTAEYQTAGRGADSNRWESAKGENLLLSLRVVPSNLPVRSMFALSETTALAIADTLNTFLPVNDQCPMANAFMVKWPNDIYYSDNKVAGILIENDLQGALVQRSIIGIGININQRCFLSDAPNPRSLSDIVGHDVERRFVLDQFMDRFTHYFDQIETGKQDALDALHERYIKHLYRRGEEHSYSDKDGTFHAILIDVEPTGHLILQDTKGHRRRYAFKEVKFGLNEA